MKTATFSVKTLAEDIRQDNKFDFILTKKCKINTKFVVDIEAFEIIRSGIDYFVASNYIELNPKRKRKVKIAGLDPSITFMTCQLNTGELIMLKERIKAFERLPQEELDYVLSEIDKADGIMVRA